MQRSRARSLEARPGFLRAGRSFNLFPERHDDLVLGVEDQIDPVRVMDLPFYTVGRPDRAIVGWQVAAIDDARPRLTLVFVDELLANAVFAVIRLDLSGRGASQPLKLERIAVGADPHALEWGIRLKSEFGTDRHKALCLLRLLGAGSDELQVENIVSRLAVEERNQLRTTPSRRADQTSDADDRDLRIHRVVQDLYTGYVENRHLEWSCGA